MNKMVAVDIVETVITQLRVKNGWKIPDDVVGRLAAKIARRPQAGVRDVRKILHSGLIKYRPNA